MRLRNLKVECPMGKVVRRIRRYLYESAVLRLQEILKRQEVRLSFSKFAATIPSRVPLTPDDRDRADTITVRNMAGEEHRFRLTRLTTFLNLHKDVRRRFGIPVDQTPISISLRYIDTWPHVKERRGSNHFQPYEPMLGYNDYYVTDLYRGTIWQLVIHR